MTTTDAAPEGLDLSEASRIQQRMVVSTGSAIRGVEPDPVAVELARLSAENRILRAALLEIAHRTMQAPLNRLARQALGHEPNPHTMQLLAEITHDRRHRR